VTDRVSLKLWDVRWADGGLGKHGNGPFATKRQAEACLRGRGFAGVVELCLFDMERSTALSIVKRAGRPLQEFLEVRQ
jgi:hypothetical protein